MSRGNVKTVAYHQPATMTIDCPVCRVAAGQQCHTRRRRAERETHQARVTAYNKITKPKGE